MQLDDLRSFAEAESLIALRAGARRERDAAGLRLFESCCAIEQVCTDLYFDVPTTARSGLHAVARGFADLTAQIARDVLFAGSSTDWTPPLVQRCRAGLAALTAILTELPDDLPGRDATLPECFSRDLVDLRSYAAFAGARAAELGPDAAVVVGIRTTGSYLAPIWHAALTVQGCHTLAVTARPKREPRLDATGHFADPSPTDVWIPPAEDDALMRAVAAGRDPKRTLAIVIDDLAFTGSSFVRVDNYLSGIGIAGPQVLFAQTSPLVPSSLTSVAAARLAARKVLTSPPVADGPIHQGAPAVRFFRGVLSRAAELDIVPTSVALAPPTFAQRHLAARTTIPIEQLRHFNPRGRDRHYRIDALVDGHPTVLFAKVFGVGTFADWDLARSRRFSEFGHRALGHTGGFLFCEWIEGRPLGANGAQQVTDDDLDRLAGYTALLVETSRAGRSDPATYAADTTGRLKRVLPTHKAALDPAVATYIRLARLDIPLVNAPRNQGHWHHIRAADGSLRRTHLDLGEWYWRMDPVEELAAAVLELGLSAHQQQHLVDRYAERTGDDNAAARLPVAAVSYVARRFDSYRFWDAQVAQLPPSYRRPSHDPLAVAEQAQADQLVDALCTLLVGAEGTGFTRV